MTDTNQEKSHLEKVGEDLFNFAIDREDVKILMAALQEEADISRPTVEYELQILKIIAVGWSISYYLEANPKKEALGEIYWKLVHDFSHSLSETTELMIGQDIDYFQILKDRLDSYITAIGKQPEAPEPAVVIGPEFARLCGNVDDVFTLMTGSRLFIAAMGRVRKYLEEIRLR